MSKHSVKAEAAWSVSDLANEFDLDRRTVTRLIKDIDPRADGRIAGGHKTYRIADVAYPIGLYCAQNSKGGTPGLDLGGSMAAVNVAACNIYGFQTKHRVSPLGRDFVVPTSTAIRLYYPLH